MEKRREGKRRIEERREGKKGKEKGREGMRRKKERREDENILVSLSNLSYPSLSPVY